MKRGMDSVTGEVKIGYGRLTQTVSQPGALQDNTKPDSFFPPETMSPQMHPSRITCHFVRTHHTRASSVGASWADVASSTMAVVVSSVGYAANVPNIGDEAQRERFCSG